MPSSSIDALTLIVRTAVALKPRRVLDLGMGTGKYGFLLREQIDLAQQQRTVTLVGVEGYADYVGDHQRVVYDEIVVDDIRHFLASSQREPFDLVLLLDVIEHFEPNDGLEVTLRSLEISPFLLIATPAAYWRQDDPSNDLETHRSWWPRSRLRRLAQRAGAQVAVARAGHKNVALLSRGASPALVHDGSVRPALRWARDNAIPDELYYRFRRATGPTI